MKISAIFASILLISFSLTANANNCRLFVPENLLTYSPELEGALAKKGYKVTSKNNATAILSVKSSEKIFPYSCKSTITISDLSTGEAIDSATGKETVFFPLDTDLEDYCYIAYKKAFKKLDKCN